MGGFLNFLSFYILLVGIKVGVLIFQTPPTHAIIIKHSPKGKMHHKLPNFEWYQNIKFEDKTC